MVRAYIQARMSSERFPGKVLAPLGGKPVIARVITRVTEVIPSEMVVVATSQEESDDALAYYLRGNGIPVFRGPLDNVFSRFQLCLEEFPCTWFFRICGDSPFLDSTLMQKMMNYCARTEVDLVTNVFPRTFPKGMSVEMLNAKSFAAIDSANLTQEEQEHLTQVYYNHSDRFKIINLESGNPALANESFVLDTIEDLRRLEKLL
jgi:spore coat polysaccharide biosynthesis protein SpsF